MKFTEINQNRMTCSECGGPAFSTLILAEKHDACYNKVRSRYKVWPSAYASGALVQCRKKGAANWGNKNEGVNEMDKSQTPPGRSGVTPDSGKEYTAKPIKAKDFAKGAADQWIKNLSKDQLDAIAGPRYKKKGVAEGNDDVWGPQGNFAGDKPVNLGGGVSKKLGVDDTVTYFGEKATILAMSKDRSVSRIHLKSGITQNVKTSDLKRVGQDVEEGWKDKLGAAALAGSMALGAGGAQARVVPGQDNTGINRLTGKPIAAQQATDTAPAQAEAPKGYSKEYLQKAADPNRFGRYMISVEKAQELLKNMQEGMAGKKPVDEDYNPEYDDEAGMADNNLETLRRAVDGLDDLIDTGDNLPEWCQEKIAVAKSMLVSVWDYMESEDDAEEEFDLIESIVDRIAAQNGVDPEMVWDDLESLTEDELYAFAVTSQLNEDWSKANKSDRTDGMSRKAVKAYRREHPGSKLQTAVTTKPSKLKKGSKASKRRKSYCSRSKGQMNMHNISCAKTPDKAICKARRRWNC